MPTPPGQRVLSTVRSARQAFRSGVKALGQDFDDAFAKIEENPIFVFGNQKSGTTVIAALLGQLTSLPATLDLRREIKDPKFDKVFSGTFPLQRFIRRNGVDFSRKIIKEPNLTFMAVRLAARFPDARTVFVCRHPLDNIRSILNRLRLPGNQSSLSPEQAQSISHVWRLILWNVGLGCEESAYIHAMAWRWRYAAELYEQHHEQWQLIRYEDFIAAKEEIIRALATQLSLPAQADIADKLDTQYQHKGEQVRDYVVFFGPDNLSRIEEICGSTAARFGYTL